MGPPRLSIMPAWGLLLSVLYSWLMLQANAQTTFAGLPITPSSFTPCTDNRLSPSEYARPMGGEYDLNTTKYWTQSTNGMSVLNSGFGTTGNNQEVVMITPTYPQYWYLYPPPGAEIASITLQFPRGRAIPSQLEVRTYTYFDSGSSTIRMQFVAATVVNIDSTLKEVPVTFNLFPRLPYSPAYFIGVVPRSDVPINLITRSNQYGSNIACIGQWSDIDNTNCGFAKCQIAWVEVYMSFGIVWEAKEGPANATLPSSLMASDGQTATDWVSSAGNTQSAFSFPTIFGDYPAMASIAFLPSLSYPLANMVGTKFTCATGGSTYTINTVPQGQRATVFPFSCGDNVIVTLSSSAAISELTFSTGPIGLDVTQYVAGTTGNIIEVLANGVLLVSLYGQPTNWLGSEWVVLTATPTDLGPPKGFGPRSNGLTTSVFNRDYLFTTGTSLDFVGQFFIAPNVTTFIGLRSTADNTTYTLLWNSTRAAFQVTSSCVGVKNSDYSTSFNVSQWNNFHITFTTNGASSIILAIAVWRLDMAEPLQKSYTLTRCSAAGERIVLMATGKGPLFTGLQESFGCTNIYCLNGGTPTSDCTKCTCTFGWVGTLCDTVGYGIGPFAYGYSTSRPSANDAPTIIMTNFAFPFDAVVTQFQYWVAKTCTITLIIFRQLGNGAWMTVWRQQVVTTNSGSGIQAVSPITVQQGDTIGFYDANTGFGSIQYSTSTTGDFVSSSTQIPGAAGNVSAGITKLTVVPRTYSLTVSYSAPSCIAVSGGPTSSCTTGLFASGYETSVCTISCSPGYLLTPANSILRLCSCTFPTGAQGTCTWNTTNPTCVLLPPVLTLQANQATFVYTIGQSIALVQFLYTGALVTVTISPALPSGMQIATTTTAGIMSGTPSTSTDPNTITYNITARNTAGNSTRTFKITYINTPLLSFSYPSMANIILGSSPTTYFPSYSGSYANLVWSVKPALPCMNFSTVTGAFGGYPSCFISATFNVSVSNTGGGSSTLVYIYSADPIPPSFTYSPVGPYIYTQGNTIAPISPQYGGAPGVNINYLLNSGTLPAGLTLSATTGVISGTPTTLQSATTLSIISRNTGGNSPPSSVIITVNPQPPSISISGTKALSLFCVNGTAITPLTVVNTGYTANFNFPLLISNLAFVGMNLTGTPYWVQPATTYTITATNAGGSDQMTITIQVNDKPLNVNYTNVVVAYTIGVAIPVNYLKSDPNGGVPVSATVSPSLPSGLALNADYSISGTPTQVTPSAVYTVSITNTNGTVNIPLTIAVNDVPPSGLGYPSRTFYRLTTISLMSPVVTGVSLTWQVTPAFPGSLGLTFSTVNGRITGTPQTTDLVGTTYTVSVSNSGGVARVNLTFIVLPAPPTSLRYTVPDMLGLTLYAIQPNPPIVSGDPVTSWTIIPAAPPGVFFDTTSGMISGTPTSDAISTATVRASNAGGSTTAIVTFYFTSSLRIGYVATRAAIGSPITATPSSSSFLALNWTIDPNITMTLGLSFNSTTGVISGTPTMIGHFEFAVIGINVLSSALTKVAFDFLDVAPTGLSYSPPATILLNTSMTPLAPSITGNVLKWTLSGSSIGVSLNASGFLNGTPNTLGVSQLTVTASNTNDQTSSFIVSLNVVDRVPTLVGYGVASATYQVGATITSNSPILTGGAATSFSVSPTLPAGLSFNTVNGKITGTPSTITTVATYTVTATNSGGSTFVGISITVVDALASFIDFTPSPDANGMFTFTLGHPVSITATSFGGSVTTWALDSGIGNGDLALVGSTVSGTPSQLTTGVQTRTLSATNSGGVTSRSFKFQVIAVQPTSLAYPVGAFVLGQPSSLLPTIDQSAGAWVITPSLPQGLALNPVTGTISGTPTQLLSARTFTVTATNSGGSISGTVTLGVVDVVPTLSYTTSYYAIVKGTSITVNPTVGGGAVVDWSVYPNLPSGLTLTNGVISGVPRDLVGATVVVTATNSGGSANAVLIFQISDTPMTGLMYSSAHVVIMVGDVMSPLIPTVQGGTPLSFSVTPTLPSGLIFSSTGAIYGTPDTPSASLVYTVVVSNTGGGFATNVTIEVRDQPPVQLAYTLPYAIYTVGVGIGSNLPMNGGGNIVSWLMPSAPAGLTFSSVDGSISGTPNSILPRSSFTIVAFNSGGNSSTTIEIEIREPVPSGLSYSSPVSYFMGVPITNNVPVFGPGSGVATNFQVYPNLPVGLLFSTSTGIISGTPQEVLSAPVSYRIKANNSAGQVYSYVQMQVDDQPPSSLTYPGGPTLIVGMYQLMQWSPVYSGVADTFTITPALPCFTLDPDSGVISGSCSTVMPLTSFTITASLVGKYFAQLQISLQVVDIALSNFSYPIASPIQFFVGQAPLSITPFILGGSTVFSLGQPLPAGITIDLSTGVLTIAPVAATSMMIYNITASNTANSLTTSFTFEVLDARPGTLMFNQDSPVYVRHNPISQNPTNLHVTGCSVSPALPQGLSSDATCMLSGTPTVVAPLQQYFFSGVSGAEPVNTSLLLQVVDLPLAPWSYGLTSITATVDVSMSESPLTVGSTDAVLYYTILPSLPPGMSMNSSTGMISGVPLVDSPQTQYLISKVNSAGHSDVTLTLNVVYDAPLNLLYSVVSATYTLGVPISNNTPTVTGSFLQFSTSGLPQGIELDPLTGTIYGVPLTVAKAIKFTVTVSNSGGSDSASLSITVLDQVPTSLTYMANPIIYNQGSVSGTGPFVLAPVSTGGFLLDYSAVPALPQGLAISEVTGVIAGIPLVSGTSTVVITGSNPAGKVSTTLVIQVIPGCRPETTCNNNGLCSDSGLCFCNAGYSGDACESCAANYYGPSCTFCLPSQSCSGHGVCGSLGACVCNAGFSGSDCSQCDSLSVSRFGDSCEICQCVVGTCASGLTGSGACTCPAGYTGPRCQYSDLVTCNNQGVALFDGSCDCKPGRTGLNCNQCAMDSYGAGCVFCNPLTTCSGNGECNTDGSCRCYPQYSGAQCDSCTSGYYNYPRCVACDATTTCNGNGVCSPTGQCVCSGKFTGVNCNQCLPGYSLQSSPIACVPCQSFASDMSPFVEDQVCGGHGSCDLTQVSTDACDCDQYYDVGTGCTPPEITQVVPALLHVGGGSITVLGHFFGLGATLSMLSAGWRCDVDTYSDTAITCTYPAYSLLPTNPPSTVAIQVTRANSCSPNKARYYCISQSSNVFSVSVGVASVYRSGSGVSLTLNGPDFGATPVLVGGVASPCTAQGVCTVPSGVGVTDVTVNGLEIATYRYRVPAISSASSLTVPTNTSGFVLILSGSNFGNTSTPNFQFNLYVNGVVQPSSSIIAHSTTTISCSLPSGQGGPLSVQVGVGGQISRPFALNYASPVVNSVTGCPGTQPTSLPAAATYGCVGGTSTITVNGANFGLSNSGLSVTVGGSACTGLQVLSHSTLTCVVPSFGASVEVQLLTIIVTRFASSSPKRLVSYAGPWIDSNSLKLVSGSASSSLLTAPGYLIAFTGNFISTGATVSVWFGSSATTQQLFPCTSVILQSATSLQCNITAGTGLALNPTVVVNGVPATGLDVLAFPLPTVNATRFVNGDGTWRSDLVSAKHWGDLIEIRGTGFGAAIGQVQVTYGPTANLDQFICSITTVSDSSIQCMTAPGSIAVGSPMYLSIRVGPRSATVSSGQPNVYLVRSPLTYSYNSDTVPTIGYVVGCTNTGTTTVNCPTSGNIPITIYGIAMADNTTVSVGGKLCPVTSYIYPRVICTLPAGFGVNQLVVVRSGFLTSAPATLSYGVPTVYSVSGCTSQGDNNTYNCVRTGNVSLTINGANFGGSITAVFVGGRPCTVIGFLNADTSLRCTLPMGTQLSSSVAVYQGNATLVGSNLVKVSYAQCNAGTYSPSLVNVTCFNCPPGTFSSLPNQFSCSSCAVGTGSGGGASACTRCSPGSFLNQSTSTCTQCLSGTFTATADAVTCVACPGGKLSSNGASFCSNCNAGWFSAPMSPTCSLCSNGTWSSQGASICSLCSTGRTSGIGATTCDPCNPGTYATTNGSASCVPAKAGQYAAGYGNSRPLACPLGTMTGSAGLSACTPCPAGQYTNQSGSSSCVSCQSGFLQLENCHECLLGSPASPINGSCITCPLGSYNPPENSSTCAPCPIGRMAGTSPLHCDLCPLGKYSNVTGSVTCNSCPPGTAPDTPDALGSRSCLTCPAGRFSKNGLSCQECAVGSVTAFTGQSTCDQCAPGNYSDITGAQTCSVCKEGRFTSNPGEKECTQCPLGRKAGLPGASACDQCQPGEYQDLLGSSTCTNCSIGSFTTTNASVSCQLCLPGQYTTSTGTTECFDCAAGYYKTQFATTCSECPTGTYTFMPGQTVCIPCGLGTYNPDSGVTVCSTCETGRYQDSIESSNCLPCAVSEFSNAPGAVTCTPCPLGTASLATLGATYCADCLRGTIGTVYATCDQCSDGTYADGVGLTSCSPCAPGTMGGGVGQSACTACGGGKFQDNPGSLTCKSCPIGTDPTLLGLSSCMDCVPGRYSAIVGGNCTLCDPGKYAASSRSTSCSSCDAGRYSSLGSDICVTCPPGSISPSNSDECDPCPAGMYQSNPGGSSCIPCPIGYIAPNNGTSVCVPCDSGRFSNNSVFDCTACEYGKVATAAGSSTCSLCPAGTFISPGQSVFCTSCAAGTYSTTPGVASCSSCPAGLSQGQLGQSQCDQCLPGFFSPIAESPTCTRCDKGQYNSARNSTQCYTCAPGSYQPETGMSSCMLCPAGKYSGEGSSECTNCPVYSIAPYNGSQYCQGCSKVAVASDDGTTCECLTGTYLDASVNQSATNPVCLPCQTGALCNAPGVTSANMQTTPGYWRANVDSTDFYKCKLAAFCMGGRQSECANGRAGLVCGWCKPGFTGGTNTACTPCSGGNKGGSLIRVILLALVFLLIAGLFDRWVLKKETSIQLDLLMRKHPREIPANQFRNEQEKLKNMKFAVQSGIRGVDAAQLSEEAEVFEQNQTIREGFRRLDREATITHQAKLSVTFFQLCAVLAFHRPIPWPTAFLALASAFNVFNFDFLEVSQTDCLGSVNFYVKFLFRISLPAVGALFVIFFYTCPQLIRALITKKDPVARSDKLKEIYMKQRKLCFFTFYLLYPLVCSFIFEMFVCTKVEGLWYLNQDYTIQCFDSRWNRYAVLGGFMVACYPIGVPLTFAIRLLKNREKLGTLRIRYELGFLYEVYRRDCWWFELVDMMHKLFITAILPFIPVDYQLKTGMGIVIGYAIVILIKNPYHRRVHDSLHLLAQCSYFLIMLAGSYFSILSDIGSVANGFMSFFLILDVCIFLIALSIALGTRVKQRVDALLATLGIKPKSSGIGIYLRSQMPKFDDSETRQEKEIELPLHEDESRFLM